MRRLLPLLALFAAGPAAADNGTDTGLVRLGQRAQLLGWEAVGRLETGEGGFCTGVLVAPDLVLTAAHCLYDRRNVRRDPRGLVFRAGLSDGNAIAEVAGRRAVIDEGFVPGSEDALERVQRDAALLQLAEPIPAGIAAPFATGRAMGPGDSVSVVSYALGRTEALSWQPGCSVLNHVEGVYALSCDVWFGSSGAPVFESSSGRARIVSVISGGNREEGRTTAFGPDAALTLPHLTEALRNGRGVFPEETVAARRLPAAGAARDIGARFLRP